MVPDFDKRQLEHMMNNQEEELIDDEPVPVVYEADIGSGARTEGEKETLRMVLEIPMQGADIPKKQE
ncbi:MAG: hypothetical protein V4632_14610 [Pseudomonadota bacterium]